MTYRGKVEHGVVVLDPRQSLPEGTLVDIVPLSPQPVGEALEKLAGTAQNLPSDLAENHDEHRRKRGK